MKFEEKFTVTDIAKGTTNFFSRSLNERWKEILPGVYCGGLFTICSAELTNISLNSWRWLTGENSIVIAYLAWGDFIYISLDDRQIYLVISQEGGKISLGDNLESVFDYNFSSEEFIQDVMLLEKFTQINKTLGDLNYGDCYVHEPYLMLGNEEKDEQYVIRSFSIYIDIVGQTWQHIKNN